jgi:tetratricopeptide (TPR) repeat protein
VNANLNLTLGILHWRRGDQEKAARFLRSALETAIASEDKWFEAECLNAIALVYTDRGQIDEAIEAYKHAIRLAPNQIFPWNNLGNLYSKLGRNDEAVAAFRKAIEHSPEDAFSWNGLGNVYLKTGQKDKAVMAYTQAIELAPNFIYPWNGLGNAYAGLGKADEAILAYQKAVEFNHHLSNPLIGLGNIYAEQGRSEEAVHAYRQALDVDSGLAHVWNALGNVHFKKGAFAEAVAAYEKVIELAPELGWPYGNQGLAYCALGKYAKALPLYKKAIQLLTSPKDQAITWNRMGDAYRCLNDRKNAMAAYQKAVELDGTPAAPAQEAEAAVPEAEAVPEAFPAAAPEPDLEAVPAFQAENHAEADEAPAAVDSPAVSLQAEAPTDESDEWGGAPETGLTPVVEEASPVTEARDENASDLQPMQEAAAPAGSEPQEAVEALPAQSETRSANEWNELGHRHLNAGAYDEAIAAYIKAIEAADELSWPYIHNLAMAHYHKGEQRGKGSKPAAPASRARDAELPQRYAEPPTEPLPAVVSTSKAEEPGEEAEALEAYAGHSLQYDAGSGADEVLPAEGTAGQPAGEMGDWLRSLEQEQADTVNRSRALDEEKRVEAEAPAALPEPESSSLEDTVQTLARPWKAMDESASVHEAEEQEQVEAPDTIEPSDALEWNEQGNIHLKAGACDRAISAYVKAIELQPDFGWPYSNLGLAYSHKGKYAEAIPLYRKSLELLKSSKEKAITWNRMGDAYRRLNEHAKAAAAYQKATELDSGGSSLLKRMRLSLLGNVRV